MHTIFSIFQLSSYQKIPKFAHKRKVSSALLRPNAASQYPRMQKRIVAREARIVGVYPGYLSVFAKPRRIRVDSRGRWKRGLPVRRTGEAIEGLARKRHDSQGLGGGQRAHGPRHGFHECKFAWAIAGSWVSSSSSVRDRRRGKDNEKRI